MNTFIITTAQATIFVTYLAYIWRTFGVLTSISASSYALQGLNRWWFFAFLGSIGVGFWLQNLGMWGNIASFGFVAAGLTIDHKDNPASHEDLIHTAGTILAITAGFAAMLFGHGIYIPTIIFAVGATALYYLAHNRIWWIECLAFICLTVEFYMR